MRLPTAAGQAARASSSVEMESESFNLCERFGDAFHADELNFSTRAE